MNLKSICNCCGSSDSTVIGHKRSYQLLKCVECSLVFVKSPPSTSELRQLYSSEAGYFSTANTLLDKTSGDEASRINKILREKGIETGKFLEIGCATGSLIYHLEKLGWEVTGTDINLSAVEVAKSYGLKVFHGELSDLEDANNKFDVVFMGDVIEHVLSPKELMEESNRNLKKSGLLLIETPNSKCGFARLSAVLCKINMPWLHSEAPYHLYEFSVESLSRLAETSGFEVVSVDYDGWRSFSYMVGASGFFDELKSSMKTGGKYRVNTRLFLNIPMLTIMTCIMIPIYYFGQLLDKAQNSGDKIIMVVRKL